MDAITAVTRRPVPSSHLPLFREIASIDRSGAEQPLNLAFLDDPYRCATDVRISNCGIT